MSGNLARRVVPWILGLSAALSAGAAHASAPMSLADWQRQVGGPTRVTLHEIFSSPFEVNKALAAQTGRADFFLPSYAGNGPPGGPIELNLERTPFWQAMSQMVGHGSTWNMPYVNLDQFSYGSGRGIHPPLTGMFVVMPSSIARAAASNITYEGAGARRDVRAGLQVSAYLLMDPKAQLTPVPPVIHLASTVDERGRSLAMPQPEQRSEWSSNGLVQDLVFNVKADSPARRIARMRGAIEVPLFTRLHTWATPLPNAASLLQQRFRAAVQEYSLTARISLPLAGFPSVTLTYDGPGICGALPWDDKAVFARLRILDGSGVPVRYDEQRERHVTSRVSATRIHMSRTYSFETEKRPKSEYALEWTVPTERASVSLPFDIRDIPIPTLAFSFPSHVPVQQVMPERHKRRKHRR